MFKNYIRRLLILLSYICYYFKRKDVVLYGTGFNAFTGHTKFHFLKNHDLCKGYWVTSNLDVYNELKSENKRVLYKNSVKHILLSLIAKNYVITHNVTDVFFLKPVGCFVTNLWHGVAIKYIGHDSKEEIKWIDKKVKAGIALPYEEWDLFVAQSEHHKRIISTAMRIPKFKIQVKTPDSIEYLKKNCTEIDNEKKLNVLYMPTFRTYNFELIYKSGLKKILNKFDDEKYNIYIKLHPLAEGEWTASLDNRINILPKSTDSFDLLLGTNVLVSDYSSVIYDFSYLNRKIFLIHDDIDEYINSAGGLYDIALEYELL